MTDVLGGEAVELEKSTEDYGGLPGFERLTPAEQNKHLQKMFKEVFGTKHGKIVLGVILEDLYYFEQCKNDEDRALNNYAKMLLSQRLGFNDNKKRIDCLFSQNI